MRNQPLGTVLWAVKAETSRVLGTTETAQDNEMMQIIYDIQWWLASEYDWPFLRARWDVTYSPGNRYLAFPTVDDISLATSINFERPVRLYVKWNSVWQPVEYGIDEIQEFNYLDPDQGVQSDPIQRWMFDDESNFEIWPLPGTNGTLRFVGQRSLTELRSSVGPPPVWNQAATLDLDDQLVTYYSASAYLLKDGKESTPAAQTMLARAQDRMRLVRASYPVRTQPPCVIGGGTRYDKKFLKTVPMVVVAGNIPNH